MISSSGAPDQRCAGRGDAECRRHRLDSGGDGVEGAFGVHEHHRDPGGADLFLHREGADGGVGEHDRRIQREDGFRVEAVAARRHVGDVFTGRVDRGGPSDDVVAEPERVHRLGEGSRPIGDHDPGDVGDGDVDAVGTAHGGRQTRRRGGADGPGIAVVDHCGAVPRRHGERRVFAAGSAARTDENGGQGQEQNGQGGARRDGHRSGPDPVAVDVAGEVLEQRPVEPVDEDRFVDHCLLLRGVEGRGIELGAVFVLERLGLGDAVEDVEPQAVALVAVCALEHPPDDLPAGQVAEIPQVMVGEKGFRRRRGDLFESLHVCLGGGERADPVAPVVADQELEVGFESWDPQQIVRENRADDRVVGIGPPDALECVVDEPRLRDQFGVCFDGELAFEQFGDEHRVLGLVVGLLRIDPDALGKPGDLDSGHRPTSLNSERARIYIGEGSLTFAA